MSKEAIEMVDDEGENRAVRMFLALYGGACGVTVDQMRKHLKMSGFDGAWPEWASTYNGHLTKAGAQLWIRHLFILEQPAQQEPVAKYIGECSDGSLVQLYDDVTKGTEFYTTPQPAQRTWVGLSDVEWMNIVNKDQAWFGQRPDEVAHEVAKLVEAKLKEKNT